MSVAWTRVLMGAKVDGKPVQAGAGPWAEAVKLAAKLRHRGPDWSGIYCKGANIIAHERLAIVDPESGDQPLYSLFHNKKYEE